MVDKVNFFFSAAHHFFHKNIIEYAKRPFLNLSHMHEELIRRHNEVVGKNDIVVCAGDFSFAGAERTHKEVIQHMNGTLHFLIGCHDRWLSNKHKHLWSKKIEGQYIVVSHYCLRTWPKSHYNSWHLFGHSHGRLTPIGKSMDIGVDTNAFYPYSMDEVSKYMSGREDNPNLVRGR